MKTTAAAAIAGALASFLTLTSAGWLGEAAGATPRQDKEVRAQKFVLVNDKGDVKAVLATDKNSRPVFALVDGNGKVRLSIAITREDLPGIGLTDSRGRSIIGLAVTQEDDAAFTLSDDKGKVQAAISIERGTGKLLLNGEVRDK